MVRLFLMSKLDYSNIIIHKDGVDYDIIDNNQTAMNAFFCESLLFYDDDYDGDETKSVKDPDNILPSILPMYGGTLLYVKMLRGIRSCCYCIILLNMVNSNVKMIIGIVTMVMIIMN